MNTQLRSFLEDVVLDNRILGWDGVYYLSVEQLSWNDKSKFLIYLLNEDDQGLYCLTENNGIEEILTAFRQVIRNPDVDNKLNFSDVAIDKVYEYYHPKMQMMIDDAVELAA